MSASSHRAFEYLEALPETTHKRLYRQPSTTLAIFRRMLPHLAKTYIMAMLYLQGPLLGTDLDMWTRSESKREQEMALDVLERLHILHTIVVPGQRRSYKLSETFGKSLKEALTGGGERRSFGVPCYEKHAKDVSIEYLDAFARTRWEAILYYIVGSTGQGMVANVEIEQGSKKLLEYGKFVEIKGRTPIITKNGFEFLLQDVNVQVWSLLIVYLEAAEERLQMDSVDVLSFLFILGSLEVGQDYSISNLTPTQVKLLDNLKDFGIIYRSSEDSTCFYPTRLATTLTSDSSALASSLSSSSLGDSANQKGFLVVETNYRIYAYTNSTLRISILSLFIQISTCYPNMTAGRISKESVQRAITYGITADQIVSYLTVYAHQQMISNSRSGNRGANETQQHTIPPTVVDQIRLWQIEGERMKTTEGFLFKNFKDTTEWEECVQYAEDLGILIWRKDLKRCFFVTDYKQLKPFILNRNRESG